MSNKIHEVAMVRGDDVYLYLNVDRQLYRIRWATCSSNLANANQTEREYMEVSPSGYGLH